MPMWQMTGEEFLALTNQTIKSEPTSALSEDKEYFYGISGIARIFGCSKATANRIKKSGLIDRAIIQIGRKIIIDKQLALQLASARRGGRR